METLPYTYEGLGNGEAGLGHGIVEFGYIVSQTIKKRIHGSFALGVSQ